MLVENQKVEVRWTNATKKYYIDKGYIYTRNGDTFFVNVRDVLPNSGVRILVQCDYCEKKKYIRAQDYYRRTENETQKYCCENRTCSQKKKIELGCYDEIRKEIMDLFYEYCNKYNCIPLSKESDYIDAHHKLTFECKKHGIQKRTWNNIKKNINKECGFCPECGKENSIDSRRLKPDEVEIRINSVNQNILLNKNDYINNRTRNLKVLCGCCKKRIFVTNIEGYISGKNKCDYCARQQSNGERYTKSILEKYDINYICQKRFDECKDKRTLPFDFYLPEYNTCIEYDGEQHFKPIRGKESFENTTSHDTIKNNYCNQNNIHLIRIPYWEFNNIEQILIKELNLTQQKLIA